MTADEIIQNLGGNTAVFNETGWPISTITSMRKYNSIPSWRQDTLLLLALKKGIALSATDFPTKDERTPLAKKAA